MSSFQVDFKGRETLLGWLNGSNKRIREAITETVENQALRLVRKVKADKLSGQVLKVQTGMLRGSIKSKIISSSSSIVANVSTNVAYGLAHEYGFKGTVEVGAHQRVITMAFGKPIAPKKVLVRAHKRKMNLPERSFLRSALAESQDGFERALIKALDRAMNP